MPRSFRSDNNAGICPEALEALSARNESHFTGYGDDPMSGEAIELFRGLLGDRASVFFVPTGTIANVLAVASLVTPWSRVLCHSHAHWNDDESTAPEAFTSCRTAAMHTTPNERGWPPSKLTPEDVERAAALGLVVAPRG